MATSTISVKYRPIKIAFLVQEGNVDDLVKAAGINTLLWGWVYNPIIPVSDNNQNHVNKLLELFNIDVFYKVSETDSINQIIEENKFLRDPSHIGDKIFYEDWQTKKNVSAYLDAINIVNFYREKEFKHNKSKKHKSNCIYLEWWKDNQYSNLFCILFWYFPNSYNLKNDFKNAFIKGLKSKKNKIKKNENIDEKICDSITPIITTGLELKGYGGWWESDGIYIWDEENFTDILNFRNLRASGIKIEFLPKNGFTKFKWFIQSYITKLDNLPNKTPNINDSIYIYYQGKQDLIKPILKKLKVKNKHFCFSQCSEISRNGLNIRPRKFYFNWEQILANTDKQFDKYNVSFSLPQKKFLTENHNGFQSLVAVIDPITEFTYPRHTLHPPFIRKLNEFYSREIKFSPWDIRSEEEWIGIIIKANDTHLSLFPVHHEKIISKIFELAGLKSNLSQAGLLTQHIISNMRESNPLEACRVFKIRWVRKLIETLGYNKKIAWGKATKIILDNKFNKFEKLYIEQRDTLKLKTNHVFNFLIKKGIFKPNLTLFDRIFTKKDFTCKNCGIKTKIKIKHYESEWMCPYCSYKHFMPQYIMEDHWIINKFNFIKNGLFSIDNHQEWAIPVTLTLLTIGRILFSHWDLFYSTSLKLKDKKEYEIDSVIINHKWDKIEIGICECKSQGKIDSLDADINENDINNLKYIQEKLNKIWVDCYLIFSKTTDKFKISELELFKKLKTENRKFILLTNNELEPYEPYWELDNTENLPRKYANNMEDMYINSVFLYLTEKK